MNKFFTLVFILLTSQVIAQTQGFGKIDISDLEMQVCDFEKDANAMVLFDKMDVYFDDSFNIVMNRHKRIKIFNDKGKDHANIRIEFYSGNKYEFINNIQAQTINLANGKPEITKQDKKLIYTESIDKNRSAIVFSLPNVKSGSVIEFSYTWNTSSLANFPDWFIQGYLPVKYSELETAIPDMLQYDEHFRIQQPLSKNISNSSSRSLGSGANALVYTVNKRIRAVSNIPSLSDEPYMGSRIDHLQSVLFQLSQIRPIGGFIKNLDNTWSKIGESLSDDEDFGVQLRRKLSNEEVIINKAKELKSDKEKIAYIFNEVKNSMKWNGINRWYTNEGVVKAWEKKIGNSTEINLILCRLLKLGGLKVYPLLVSTRDHGKVFIANPSVRHFNKTVAYIPVDSTHQYVLDATDKYYTYNQIPDNLLNSFGLWIDRENKRYEMVSLINNEGNKHAVNINAEILATGQMIGSAQISSFNYNKQNAIRRYQTDGEEKYKEHLRDQNNNLKIESFAIGNLEVDTLPLTQRINFSHDLAGSEGDYIYFSPNLFTSLQTNPFLNEQRSTDINFGFIPYYAITGSFKIPQGYQTDALPKSISMVTPDRNIIFRRAVAESEGSIQIRYTIEFKNSIFFKEDYPDFREFYKKIHELLNEPIVLKKS